MANRYDSLNEPHTFETYGQALDECGWLALLTDAQRDSLRTELAERIARDKRAAYTCLATHADDMESIYDLGPSSLSYWGWITDWADVSRGLFQPTDIQTEYTRDKDGRPMAYRVSFRVDERLYQLDTETLSDYLDIRLLDVVNRAMREAGGDLQFRPLPFLDQALMVILVPEAVYRCAVRRGLIPPPAYYYPRDHEWRDALCDWFYELIEQTSLDTSVLETYEQQKSAWMAANPHKNAYYRGSM